MGKAQQQSGKNHEESVMLKLQQRGYWVTKLQTGFNGTVFDILAIKEDTATAIECKSVQKGQVLKYTQELKKKTDELNAYYLYNNRLFLIINFEGTDYMIPWGKAYGSFLYNGCVYSNQCTLVDL